MSGSVIKLIEHYKIVAIIRGLYGPALLNLAEALYAGGIRLLEVTFDQSDPDCLRKTPAAIAELREHLGEDMRFGAGTVLSAEQAKAAGRAGAEFIISPDTKAAVVETTKAMGLVSIPAGMTPTEILRAHELGADMVKVFPAAWLGLSWFKDIRSPVNHVPMMATGGVSEENLGAYLAAGYAAAGIGGRLTDRNLIALGRFDELTKRAAACVRAAEAAN